ncbi:transketolase [Amaricoccus solimangrovi]|uniref:Transketolase n=1 Tax=Amaricoccus solimangrovi TaxID=2589815 RepID=A0A501WRV8_9RHOB|nr:transketolase [Amaricoccus solimangrovi]TPE48506.1 transketolase [Amaricoccus solimangrovi]
MTIEELRQRHPDHWKKAAALRMLAIDAVQKANSGHPGMPMGMADVATVLFEKYLKFDPTDPNWPDRDRFVLSAGHGSMLLYGLLHLTGYPGMSIDEIKRFRQLGSKTEGHPERHAGNGIETTTGPLGQGIATSVGMAIAEAHLAAQWGRKLVDHWTYVIAGDGCLMEGISQEAVGLAGMQKLDRLVVFWDDNGISIDGKVSLSDRTDQLQRFAASGWSTHSCDGHDPEDIDRAIREARASGQPALIDCKTHIGWGAPTKQDTKSAHGSPLGDEEIAKVREIYGWPYPAFEIPEDIRAAWQATGGRGAAERAAWSERLGKLSNTKRAEFERIAGGVAHPKLASAINAFKKEQSEAAKKVATRKSSEMALEVINAVLPETIGGSADLTGSNNTLTKDLGVFDETNRAGRYVHYGIREHGMAAAMNGIAAHGGLVPYGGTFLVFSDYARGAIRLSALMGLRVVYVLTHDSIGLGEDGPTHQPVEHLAALRAMPGLQVLRPADTIETAEAWEIALSGAERPSVLALTRQNLPVLRTAHSRRNLSAQGAYVLAEAEGKRRAILLATGSEVEIAMKARDILQGKGIGTRVVSMPSFELFAAQEESYRKKVLPSGAVRVAVEAGVRQGWDRWLMGERGAEKKAGFVGMSSFGASGPIEDLYPRFGITAEAVAAEAEALL